MRSDRFQSQRKSKAAGEPIGEHRGYAMEPVQSKKDRKRSELYKTGRKSKAAGEPTGEHRGYAMEPVQSKKDRKC